MPQSLAFTTKDRHRPLRALIRGSPLPPSAAEARTSAGPLSSISATFPTRQARPLPTSRHTPCTGPLAWPLLPRKGSSAMRAAASAQSSRWRPARPQSGRNARPRAQAAMATSRRPKKCAPPPPPRPTGTRHALHRAHQARSLLRREPSNQAAACQRARTSQSSVHGPIQQTTRCGSPLQAAVSKPSVCRQTCRLLQASHLGRAHRLSRPARPLPAPPIAADKRQSMHKTALSDRLPVIPTAQVAGGGRCSPRRPRQVASGGYAGGQWSATRHLSANAQQRSCQQRVRCSGAWVPARRTVAEAALRTPHSSPQS